MGHGGGAVTTTPELNGLGYYKLGEEDGRVGSEDAV